MIKEEHTMPKTTFVRKPCTLDVPPTYTVADLRELFAILQN